MKIKKIFTYVQVKIKTNKKYVPIEIKINKVTEKKFKKI